MQGHRPLWRAAVMAVIAATTGCAQHVTAGSGPSPSVSVTASGVPASASASTGPGAAAAAVDAALKKVTSAGSVTIRGRLAAMYTEADLHGALAWGGNGLTGEMAADTRTSDAAKGFLPEPDPFTARYAGQRVYGRYGSDVTSKLQGRHWIAFDTLGLAATARDSGLALLPYQLSRIDPVSVLTELRAAVEVDAMGPDAGAGPGVTVYSGMLGAEQLAALAARGADAGSSAQLRDRYRAGRLTSETITVWIGPEGVPVKALYGIAAATGSFNTTVEYAQYGTTVPAPQAPDARDTTEAAQALAALPNIGARP
ncbi:hypothetical protein [Kitasatospora paranensis]|uniref:Lipoprotein n=1 Tax=Kitasatospora paranensis TaxID=258053 RepID=A0ABW2G1S9_9ACTN